jgi:hypothetical protein
MPDTPQRGASLGVMCVHTWVAREGRRTVDDVLERRLVPRFFLQLAQGRHPRFFFGAALGRRCVE